MTAFQSGPAEYLLVNLQDPPWPQVAIGGGQFRRRSARKGFHCGGRRDHSRCPYRHSHGGTGSGSRHRLCQHRSRPRSESPTGGAAESVHRLWAGRVGCFDAVEPDLVLMLGGVERRNMDPSGSAQVERGINPVQSRHLLLNERAHW